MNFLAKLRLPLGVVTLLLLGLGLWLGFSAPPDFQQGYSVRIMYLHVPSAKMALLVYLVLTGAAAWHLWKRSETADIIAEAAAPVGAAFAAVTLITGSIWGKPMWGVWWAWDARLTSMLVLLVIYVGLMALRGSMEDPVKGGRATAVLAIIGLVDLPIIHFSVVWWRTLHQPASFQGSAKVAVTGDLLTALLTMSVAFVALGGYLLIVKAQAVAAQRQLEALEAERFDHA